jgi:hypothetical protein
LSRGPAWTETPRRAPFTSDDESAKREILRAWFRWESKQPLTPGGWDLLEPKEREEIRLLVKSAKRALSWR